MRKLYSFAIVLTLCGVTINSNPVWAKTATKVAQAKQAPPLPIFDFLGQNTESDSTMTSLNGSECSYKENSITDCTDYNRPSIGGVKLKYISMHYYNSKMYMVFGSTFRRNFSELLLVFKAKYGEPVIETRTWKNSMGASLDNPVAIWKFRGGNLELAAIGSRIDDTDFTFISAINAPPPPSRKVDF